MPKRMAQLMTRILSLLFAALLIAGPARTATAQDEATLILTGNTRSLFPVMSKSPGIDDAPERFREKVGEIRQQHPDAILADAGNSISFHSEGETAYNYTSSKMFDDLDYSVVNLSARDAVLSTVRPVGFQRSPGKYREPLITDIESTNPRPLDLPISKTVEQEGNAPVTFVSMSDLESAAGISGKVGLAREIDRQRIEETIAAARAREEIVVGFSSLTEENRENWLARPDVSPHLLVDLLSDSPPDPRQIGQTWVIPPPLGGEIFSIQLEKGDEGLREPIVAKHVYLTREEYNSLFECPIPKTGLPLPQLGEVVGRYFDIGADNVRVDKVDGAPYPDLTTLEQPYVYHLKLEGEPHRMYRIYFQMPDPRFDRIVLSPGWPIFDYLVVLDDRHVLQRVINRSRFPVGTLSTTLLEAMNKLQGQRPGEWQADPVLSAGLDQLWECGTEGIKKAIELDKQLYGEGGDYVRAR